jgi:hypothetical protein
MKIPSDFRPDSSEVSRHQTAETPKIACGLLTDLCKKQQKYYYVDLKCCFKSDFGELNIGWKAECWV